MLPPDWGVSRVMLSRRPWRAGSVARASRVICVAAPVRSELKTASEVGAVTVTSTAIERTMKSRSVATPRLTMMSSWVCASNPDAPAVGATVTLYGPPTRMFSSEYRPSGRVVVSYVVPDGTCSARTVAPATGFSCASFTRPASDPVVTPWATASVGSASPNTAHNTRVLLPSHDVAFSKRFMQLTPQIDTGFFGKRPLETAARKYTNSPVKSGGTEAVNSTCRPPRRDGRPG